MKVKGNRFTWHIHLAHPKKEISARNFFALTSKRTDHMAHMAHSPGKLNNRNFKTKNFLYLSKISNYLKNPFSTQRKKFSY